MEIVLTIDENGDQVFLKSEGAKAFLELGKVETSRASHVEPDAAVLRWLFHFIRQRCTDDSRIAGWTRTWCCSWRVNTAPLDGPILSGRWRDRSQAIAAEIEYVNERFLCGH
jgi:hypothetical protein